MENVTSFFSQTQTPKRIIDDLPNISIGQILKMFRADSVAWGGATTLLDRILENGYQIRDLKTGKQQKNHEKTLRNKDFDFFLREIILHLILFKNGFIEFVIISNDQVKEFHTIDPTKIGIKTNKHNEVEGYTQEPEESVKWQPNEILHIKDVAVDLTQWGEASTQTIFEAVETKIHINKFIKWLFETNQFRGIYNPTNIDEEAIKRSITFLKESEKNINKPVIFEGEFNYIVTREFKDLAVLNELIYKKDEEILNYLQVPPIYAGLPDNSNRSNSDAQERAFETTVKALQQIIKWGMDKFLRKMRMFNSEFVFNPVSVKVSREMIETAQLMNDISMKKEIIADFLRTNGLNIPQGDVFEKPPEMVPGQMPGEAPTGNDTLSPSRRPKPTGQANAKIGTGDRGTTREDQLVSRAGYPFTYDKLDEPQG